MNKYAALATLAALALIPSAAQAHFLWAYADGVSKTVRLEVAESPGESIAPILGGLLSQIEVSGAKGLRAQGSNGLVADLSGPVAAFKLTYGLHGTDLVTWWAKAGALLTDVAKPMGQEFELVASRKGHGVTAWLTRFGKPISGAAVEAYGGGIAKGASFKTDAKGVIVIRRVMAGQLALGAMLAEAGGGQFKGQAYTGKLNLVSLTVVVK